jgi:bifunctional DNase/RNase
MKEDMLRVRVKAVAMPSKHEAPVVILEVDGGSGECVVAVGASEAGAILMELEGVSTPRPLTHELVAQVFKEQGISIRRVELYGLYGSDEDGYLARIAYGRGLRTWIRDVRPSDALALAVASGAPVFAHQSLISRHEECWFTEALRA